MHKVTSKRQVTIPQNICEAMQLEPGDYVEIFERDGVAHVVKMQDEDLAGKYHHLTKDKAVPSAKTLKQAIQKHAASKFLNHDRD